MEPGSSTLSKIARASENGQDAARGGAERVRDLASAAAENGSQTLQRSADETVELGRTVVDLLGEQTRHNLHAAAAIGQAVDWAEVARAQRDFVAGSFERMNQFAQHYRAMMRAGMSAMSFPGRR
jgi:hypothetical protein